MKSGRMHVDRGQPDLVLEEADHSKVPSRSRLYREGAGNDGGGAEGRSTDAGAGAKVEKNPYRSLPKSEKPQVKTPERFKVGDRVKCACKKWCLSLPCRRTDALAARPHEPVVALERASEQRNVIEGIIAFAMAVD